jgi:hypothetical protein
MKTIKYYLLFLAFFPVVMTNGQTSVIPNAGFEEWTDFGNYSNPKFWDTPNQETAIPFVGVTTVTRSNDAEAGSFSARLETMHMSLPPIDVPGVITLGTLSVDIAGGTFLLEGGVPCTDIPTHLKGYYKFLPQGGDSCAIGIGLTKYQDGVRDSIGIGYFSEKNTVSDWTPFSAWIDYDTLIQPDTMNILALSTAQESMTPGTVLFVDDLYLDYTVGVNESDPKTGIDQYNDRETKRLLVFLDFEESQQTSVSLYDMMGKIVFSTPVEGISKGRIVVPYSNLRKGIYILEVMHDRMRFSKKYFLSQE